MTKYKRVLLKLSGEALMGTKGFGLDADVLNILADELADVAKTGVELAIVVGGGNIFRGMSATSLGIERTSADYMGMLGTVMNAISLQNVIEKRGVDVRVMSALHISEVAEPFIQRRAVRHLEKGRVVIFAAGLGRPYFTTDTTSALRAAEINADLVLKGTSVDGVYSADPKKDPQAKRYDQVSFDEVITKELKVMDATAFTLCKENNMPIFIFDMTQQGNILDAVAGQCRGTLVH